ncbi:MAG: response regulator, partial [Limisphaerales bacterium]
MAKAKAVRVLLIDDHPLLRRGVATLINNDDIFEVCGEISVPRKAVAAVRVKEPDVVVLDLTFEG